MTTEPSLDGFSVWRSVPACLKVHEGSEDMRLQLFKRRTSDSVESW